MISDFFIRRPVLANVLAILMMVIGIVALFALPVAQYPDVVPPTVQVTTRYPGASAGTVIDAVALPIEQQVDSIEGMIYMQSYSAADGTYTLTVTFKIGVDLNVAQILVQNRVSSALSSLPQAVQAQGVVVQKNSTAILQIVTLTSPDQRYDSLYLANFATIKLKDEIARLPGVGNVVVFGAGQYSMRIWLDPDKMRARGLVPQDVIQALQQQSEQVTAGQIGAPPAPSGQSFQYTLNVAGKLSDPAEFAAVIVKTGQAGEITRVRDVATVELGAQTYGQVFSLDGKPSAGLAIFQAPGANALDVAGAVNRKMAALTPEFPTGLVSSIPFDTTKFVQQSIHEVYKTLYEAAILVLIVILVFLQDWRAMLIPATTVPVTIIGAFAAMAALGFTVNFSTLFAIVLAIGIVVDDAIVVVEGAVHNIEKGLSGREAASAAMRELFGPIIGITVPLGTLVTITPTVGPSLISLFNLYPTATIIGLPADGFSSGEVLTLMEEIARRTLPPGTGFEWSSLSFQEKLVGHQMYMVFGLALLLVYLVLAGQYESWYAPVSVILAVPLSFIGPVAALLALGKSGLNNNLYVQIGLVLLMALSAKNAILIVEFARELRERGMTILESAVGAARARFRPIVMTSLAFILG